MPSTGPRVREVAARGLALLGRGAVIPFIPQSPHVHGCAAGPPQVQGAHAAAGEAEAIYRRSDATAKGIDLVSEAVTTPGGAQAASLRVAEQYLAAFGQIAKQGNTMLLPAATHDPASMVAQAMSIYRAISDGNSSDAAPPAR